MKEVDSSLHDPNADLSPEERNRGLQAATFVFHRCRMEPKSIEGIPDNSFIYGEFGHKKFLVYVLISSPGGMLKDISQTPQILRKVASELGAEPHVVYVKMMQATGGTAFRYAGFQEFEAAVKANVADWQYVLLKGRPVGEFLRIAKGHVSRLEINIGKFMQAELAKRQSPEERILAKIFDEVEQLSPEEMSLVVSLSIDGRLLPSPHLGLLELLASVSRSGEYGIFTCSCGNAGCADVWRKVVVVHEGAFTIWKAYGLNPRRIFVFDRNQYRAEILAKLKQFMAEHKLIPRVNGAYLNEASELENKLSVVEQEAGGRSSRPTMV